MIQTKEGRLYPADERTGGENEPSLCSSLNNFLDDILSLRSLLYNLTVLSAHTYWRGCGEVALLHREYFKWGYQIIITFPKLTDRCPAGDTLLQCVTVLRDSFHWPLLLFLSPYSSFALIFFSQKHKEGASSNLHQFSTLSFFNLSSFFLFPLSSLSGLHLISLLCLNFVSIALISYFSTLFFFVLHSVPLLVNFLLLFAIFDSPPHFFFVLHLMNGFLFSFCKPFWQFYLQHIIYLYLTWMFISF